MGVATATAKQFKNAFDSIHAFGYFAPELEAAFTAAGLRPGRMCYFAGRSAPMGAVGPATVAATFYNFNVEVIARHLPRAWTLATPEQVVTARFAGIDAAFTRLLGAEALAADDIAEAAELAREAVSACRPEGRPLYAGHATVPWPDRPHLVLWHALTLLREHRGDGHIAALVLNGLAGLPALVTHTATGNGFLAEAAKKSRGWSDEQWAAAEAELRESGILGEDGKLTEAGEALRERIEEATNAATEGPWAHLGPEKTARLEELCVPISARLVAAGAFPPGVFATGRP
ncbi:SCO6745 family protein [Amycolatopsis samaneae]|uniref:SalK n=1 Tax=Amycolatopsis samaneae TaxID=664691 RepID=A0ABW5GKX2_9PSEU